MARTPRNRIGIKITDSNTTVEYLNKFSSMDIHAAGGYSKNINNDGWVTQTGPFDIENQGHAKSIAWSIFILANRASNGCAEASTIVGNIVEIVTAASLFKTKDSITAQINAKPEVVDTSKVDSTHSYQHNSV